MNSWIQGGLLAAYRVVVRTGILETQTGYALFERLYDKYKLVYEAACLKHVRSYVTAGSTVVDVGAHVGFFTQTLGAWVGPQGRVLAIEPEPVNFARLHNRVQRNGLASRVILVNAAAVDTPGSRFLKVDPVHPGDHQLANGGLPVRGVTLDELLADLELPAVSLVKLDVQGAELKVLKGAVQLLRLRPPNLMIEVDEERLRLQGTSAGELFGLLASHGYTTRLLRSRGLSGPLSVDEALAAVGPPGRYADFLFLPPGSS
jgi:FkbM family methyltransferase